MTHLLIIALAVALFADEIVGGELRIPGLSVGAAVAITLAAQAILSFGVLAWGGRVLAAVPRDASGPRVQPSALADPWRSYVTGAQEAKARFDRVVRDMGDGPLRDRLAGLASRLEDGVHESWRIARRGDDISSALDRLDADRPRAELVALQQSLGGRPASAAAAQTIRSLEAQIAAATRLQATADDARDRLRLLDARFDELVARAIEVGLGAGDTDVLGDDVDGLVTELESLRVALEETDAADAAATRPATTRALPPPESRTS